MQTEPQTTIPPEVPAGPPPTPEKKLIVPVWHTIVFLIVLIGFSVFNSLPITSTGSSSGSSQALPQKLLALQYVVTMVFEGALLLLVWWGIRMNQVSLKELIGGRWKTPEDFLLDLGLAIGFWVIAIFVIAGLGYVMGLAGKAQVKEAKKLADLLAPQGWSTIVLWVVLSCVAGFVEEIVFRGYLQRQLGAITGNIYFGLVISAIFFGGGHGYEGARRMVIIAIYGVMFGLLTLWRKSLRPGMIAHAWHDAFEGLLLRFMSRSGGFSAP